MKTVFRIFVLLVLALISAGIVFAVNAPRWFDRAPASQPMAAPPAAK